MIQQQIRQRGGSRPVLKPVTTPYNKMKSYAPKGKSYRPFSKWASLLKYASLVARRPVFAAANAETKNSSWNMLSKKADKQYKLGLYSPLTKSSVTTTGNKKLSRPTAFLPIKTKLKTYINKKK